MNKKDKLINELKESKIVVAELGTKLEAFFFNPNEADSVSNSIKWGNKMMDKGYFVTWSDGTKERVLLEPIENWDAEASDRYEWNESGNSIRCERVVYTTVGDTTTQRVTKKVWRKFN